jgi:riboflavin synthase
MFTGIVEELGTVEAVERLSDAVRLTVRASTVVADAALGDSIAVNGCCLTVTERDHETFTADVMRETLDKTALGILEPGARVNLERAVTPSSRLGGHIVQGHVDGTGSVVRRTPSEHWEVVEVTVPAGLAHYLVAKGSITVDGVSLTVVDVDDGTGTFTVSLIPETLARTTLGFKQPGDPVNLEVDVIAKYVERLVVRGDGEAAAAPGRPPAVPEDGRDEASREARSSTTEDGRHDA